MHKIFLYFTISLLLFSLLPLSLSGAEYEVTANSLNVRKCPGTQCEVIGKVYKGDTLQVMHNTEQWAEIWFNESQTGYVAIQFLDKIAGQKLEKTSHLPSLHFSFKILFQSSYWLVAGIILLILFLDGLIFYIRK